MLLKAVSSVAGRGKSKNSQSSKMFTLRNVDPEKVTSREDLKALIRSQLQGDIVSRDFDVGVVSGGNIVSIRTRRQILQTSGLTSELPKSGAMD